MKNFAITGTGTLYRRRIGENYHQHSHEGVITFSSSEGEKNKLHTASIKRNAKGRNANIGKKWEKKLYSTDPMHGVCAYCRCPKGGKKYGRYFL